MGYLRFRRRLRIAKGLHLNLSKSGPSISVGGRGASVTFCKHGTRTTVGLPGTGLSYTQTHNSRQSGHMSQPGSNDEARPLSPLRWVLITCLILAAVVLAILGK
jgi:hypothetical protein